MTLEAYKHAGVREREYLVRRPAKGAALLWCQFARPADPARLLAVVSLAMG